MDAIVRLAEFIYDSLNAKSHTLCVFVDLSKAFDTVNHLFLYGIGGKPLSLVESYLHNRVQSVRLGTVFSGVRNINIGVPMELSWVLSYFCST